MAVDWPGQSAPPAFPPSQRLRRSQEHQQLQMPWAIFPRVQWPLTTGIQVLGSLATSVLSPVLPRALAWREGKAYDTERAHGVISGRWNTHSTLTRTQNKDWKETPSMPTALITHIHAHRPSLVLHMMQAATSYFFPSRSNHAFGPAGWFPKSEGKTVNNGRRGHRQWCWRDSSLEKPQVRGPLPRDTAFQALWDWLSTPHLTSVRVYKIT